MFRFVPPDFDLAAILAELLAQVPSGRVTTYGDLANALGARIAARWVGAWMMRHDHGPACGCHRVVRRDGTPGLYIAGSSAEKLVRLAAEGVDISCGSVDLARFGFTDFHGVRPLAELHREQEEIVRRASLSPPNRTPALVGGVDVSYFGDGRGVAAYALVEWKSRELVWSHVRESAATFPYISSFLSFRELPLLLPLLDEVRAAGRMADVILVDGSGILHQRQAGIATHFGVAADVPTIGVTKKLLCGGIERSELEPGESCRVMLEGRPVGMAIRGRRKSRRPLFVSPGHRVDVEYAARVVEQMLVDRRLPEPIYWADRLSRQAARATVK